MTCLSCAVAISSLTLMERYAGDVLNPGGQRSDNRRANMVRVAIGDHGTLLEAFRALGNEESLATGRDETMLAETRVQVEMQETVLRSSRPA